MGFLRSWSNKNRAVHFLFYLTSRKHESLFSQLEPTCMCSFSKPKHIKTNIIVSVVTGNSFSDHRRYGWLSFWYLVKHKSKSISPFSPLLAGFRLRAMKTPRGDVVQQETAILIASISHLCFSRPGFRTSVAVSLMTTGENITNSNKWPVHVFI